VRANHGPGRLFARELQSANQENDPDKPDQDCDGEQRQHRPHSQLPCPLAPGHPVWNGAIIPHAAILPATPVALRHAIQTFRKSTESLDCRPTFCASGRLILAVRQLPCQSVAVGLQRRFKRCNNGYPR
jgi:hypothetical protein